MDKLTRIVLDPKYHDFLTIVKGFRNGVVYGTRIRFPHALVMAFLFKSGSYVFFFHRDEDKSLLTCSFKCGGQVPVYIQGNKATCKKLGYFCYDIQVFDVHTETVER